MILFVKGQHYYIFNVILFVIGLQHYSDLASYPGSWGRGEKSMIHTAHVLNYPDFPGIRMGTSPIVHVRTCPGQIVSKAREGGVLKRRLNT